MKKKKLLVISHTEHYRDASGNISGWGPTVRELNHLAKAFDHIYHAACLYEGVTAPSSSATYTEPNITFVALPPAGGKGLLNKLKIVAVMPVVLSRVSRYLRKTDVFQVRVPTSMGVYLLPFITLFVKKTGWIKYAGNWNQQSPPLSYAFQRFWLANCQRRIVTINGKWPDQPRQCISFENPCLTAEDRKRGGQILQTKKFSAPLTACFAGRLDDAKGVGRILDALLKSNQPIGEIHFIGDGPDREKYEQLARNLTIAVYFHGFSAREKVFEIFSRSHIFMLPSSASEGFPKVIAEAANVGCTPVVSNVSAIPHYVTNEVGFVWNPDVASFTEFFNSLDLTDSHLEKMAVNAYTMAEAFTFDRYITRIKDILGEKN